MAMSYSAYRFSFHHNGSHAFAKRTGLRRCEACGELLAKREEPLPGLVISKRRLDMSSTYDGVRIASARFKAIVEDKRLFGLTFYQLPDDSRFFRVDCSTVVPFDPVRRG